MSGANVPIAVIGLGALLPGSPGVDDFWRCVVSGRDLIKGVPPTHWLVDDYYDPDPTAPDKTYGRRGAFLDPVAFDPMAYGIPPNQLSAIDTTQLLSLIVADRVLRDATGGSLAQLDRERVSVILGTAPLELLATMASRLQRPVWRKALLDSGIPEESADAICERIAAHYVPWQEASFPGLLSNVVAGRIANRFDLHGTNYTTDAACASSLAALTAGVNELTLGQADMVITGGVDTLNDITMYMCFSKTPALSPSGDCKPFSDQADGTILGEGLVMFALKRLADAERDGDGIYAVLKGMGSASDGRSTAIYAPLADGQSRALRRAYESAGYGPETVELVEAHGTGTLAGDLAEFTALRAVFSAGGRQDSQWCALGSVKSQIGHTKSAAGAAGLLKAVLALHHKLLPPTIKVERPNRKLDLGNSPLYLNTVARPWIRDDRHPRRASVSSFGFGGSNFHLTLEEYVPGGPFRVRTAPTELVLLSAPTPQGLVDRVSTVGTSRSLPDIARASQREFAPGDGARLAVVASDVEDLVAKLRAAVTAIAASPGASFTSPSGVSYATGAPPAGKVAFLFSGQGSQYVGMGADLAMEYPVARRAWDRAAGLDFAVHSAVFPVPAFSDEERAAQQQALTATELAQPALAVASLAALGLLDALGVRPDVLAGHSFGELVALHAAGAFDAEALVRLARRRGAAMRDAASVRGAMLAVSAPRAVIEALLDGLADVWIANHNAPDQVVVSGAADGITAVEGRLSAAGITGRRLQTATAFHSPLVEPASASLAEYLRSMPVGSPRIPVYGNADAAPYPASPDGVRQRLATHLAAPVRFVDEVEAMYAAGVRTFVEIGAGSTLTALVDRILGGRPHLAVSLDRKGRNGVTALHEALGRLAVAGVGVNFDALWADHAPPVPPSDEQKPRMTTMLSGANFGKPYPPVDAPAAPPAIAPVPVLPDPVVVAEPAPVPRADAVPVPAPAPAGLQSLVLTTVADKTGYPVDMLEPHMDLEADLGIDSIKRVEILAAIRRAEPNLPDLDPMQLAKLRTLGEIITQLNGRQPAAPVAQPDPGTPEATDLESLVLTTVADKTGYPVDMLEPHMDLEADLGIDSIKRVEILAAIRRAEPNLPDLDPMQLAKLRTLGEIITQLNGRQPAPAIPAVSPEDGLTRHAVRVVPASAPGFALPGLGKGPVVVTDDGNGTAEHVVTRLRAHGIAAEARADVVVDNHAVVYLGGLADVQDVDEALAVQRRAFAVARTVAPAVAERGGVFVTVQDTGGDFGSRGGDPARAWLGGIAGLARTAAREWPSASVKAIDCERGDRHPAAIAGAIVHELLTGGSALDVGLRADGTRTTIEAVVAPREPGAGNLVEPDSLIVATGGARGVTAEALKALARAVRPKLVVLGRTQLGNEPAYLSGVTEEAELRRAVAEHTTRTTGRPPTPAQLNTEVAHILAAREIAANLDAMSAAGAQVWYLPVDIRDDTAVRLAVEEVRAAWGPITGIVHGAGVLADKLIADKTDEQFDRVFDTKVRGLRALLDATAEDPLTVLCLFSSVSAHIGNPGQCDYAMANEVLNHVAHAQHASRPGLRVASIAWGPWEGGMVGPALAEHFHRQGFPLIPVAQGAQAFVAELAGTSSDTHVVIAAGDAGPIYGAAARPARGEIRLNSSSHPYLADHGIDGIPVVPVALVLEWFTAAAKAWLPGGPALIRDVRVLRRAGLQRFSNGGDRLTVQGSRDGSVSLALELLGDNDSRHYRAQAACNDGRPLRWEVPDDLHPVPRRIYGGGVLFHGPWFQAIHRVEGVSASGAAAVLAGVGDMGWAGDGWHTDPAAVDGGLQLALLWGERVLGGASLPMGVSEYRAYQAGLYEGRTMCVVRARDVRPDSADCDIAFLAADGSVRAELLGVSLVRRPA
ncbi:type I polyketide synthase [Micromonospora sp. CB01531]|uniref:type I polyketide synthase n=1 Tax=Micromonospora sp. CB01531 TaxID=1718947 RepID=UPI000940463E|nr:type I polyketide synthase [Micromonospora sp. CB01531]OKI46063.1 hypothetical protein A6A27_37445 [Micromonospora sp. CB01531]